jgi:hypothetical protein
MITTRLFRISNEQVRRLRRRSECSLRLSDRRTYTTRLDTTEQILSNHMQRMWKRSSFHALAPSHTHLHLSILVQRSCTVAHGNRLCLRSTLPTFRPPPESRFGDRELQSTSAPRLVVRPLDGGSEGRRDLHRWEPAGLRSLDVVRALSEANTPDEARLDSTPRRRSSARTSSSRSATLFNLWTEPDSLPGGRG